MSNHPVHPDASDNHPVSKNGDFASSLSPLLSRRCDIHPFIRSSSYISNRMNPKPSFLRSGGLWDISDNSSACLCVCRAGGAK
jgi:hypothetical protein